MKNTFVYMIGCRYKTDAFIKIGVSNNPKKRLKQIQTGNPFILSIIILSEPFETSIAYLKEKTLHNIFQQYSAEGEWFIFNYKNHYKEVMNQFQQLVGKKAHSNSQLHIPNSNKKYEPSSEDSKPSNILGIVKPTEIQEKIVEVEKVVEVEKIIEVEKIVKVETIKEVYVNKLSKKKSKQKITKQKTKRFTEKPNPKLEELIKFRAMLEARENLPW